MQKQNLTKAIRFIRGICYVYIVMNWIGGKLGSTFFFILIAKIRADWQRIFRKNFHCVNVHMLLLLFLVEKMTYNEIVKWYARF